MMQSQDEREWYSGESRESFAAAARAAVEKAEAVIDGEELPTEYDVRLQVLAEGPLSGYRVLVSPTG
jgi:flavin-binding protein dodecin